MTDNPRFLVVRYHWRHSNNSFARLPGETVLAAFETLDAAEAVCRQQETAARAHVGNPFRVAEVLSSLPDPVFRDWLRDYDIDPPADADWPHWWDGFAHHWTDRQQDAVWQALDRLRFYAVVERPVLYAVVETGWEYNDSGYTADAEGGAVLTLYRSREKAEAERDRLRAVRLERDRDIQWACYSCGSRLNADPFREPVGYPDGYLAPGDAPYYEVIEVPAGDEP